MHEILPDLGFFDDVPGRDEDQWGIEPPRQPDWIGPPDNMTGGTVVLDLVLANTGDAAVAMRGAWAFPTGVVLRLGLHRRPVGSLARDTFERFRFGVELPDGRKVLGDRWDDETAGARLVEQGGGGGGLEWRQDYWLWPLPPEGTLKIALWPDDRPVG